MASLAGQKLDKYEVLEEVGHGGMAVVYRARDTVLDREVAVKVLHTHLADRDESRRRLQREAKTVAKLRHDNIVEIFDSSDPDRAGDTYLICEFIHGVTLRDWLDKRRKTRPVMAALIAHRLCLALDHAHSLGIVHRDIKPENVMIRNDGCLKLMDFGIAQILDTQRLTTTGQLLGSPAYMAPELINGKPIDNRSDIFALGVMFYQIATGELPFAGRNPAQVLNRILEGDYRPPSQVDPRIDQDLSAIIQRALALEPADRYQTARSMAADIEGYLAFHEIEPRPEELAAYFADPDNWEVGIDTRVCRVLTRKATRALRDGRGARALKLLSRVLEIDPQDGRAKAMLDKVRVRGQRMRQIAFAGGSLALAGIIAAGIILLQPEPPTPKRVDGGELAEFDRADPDAVVPYADRESLPSTSESGEVIGETGDADDEGRTPAKTTGVGPSERPPEKVACKLRVEGLPAATVATYKVRVPKLGDFALSKTGEVVLELSAESHVSLRGESYEGTTTIDPERDCDGVVVLSAAAKAATIEFKSGEIPLSDLLVTCESGCLVKKPTSAKNFPKIPLEAGKTHLDVVLTFQSTNYRRKEGNKYLLNPGKNEIRVDLERLP